MSILYSVGSWYGAERPFTSLFESVVYLSETGDADDGLPEFLEGDVILFGGGSDISPTLYGQRASVYNHAKGKPSTRDLWENYIFRKGQEAGTKFLGICRGAQLLCALSGGTVVQHVTHHAGKDHEIETNDGRVLRVSSAHHQMMNPFKIPDHQLIAWSEKLLSTCYISEGEENLSLQTEPEVVYFPTTNSLGIQYHPEFMSNQSEAVFYSRELVEKFLLEK